ncbi:MULTISPECIES: hypothetical protein [Paenibacillus]|uniref:hypothetical protein n=1 Tax=Paenibacillus TaxID=44249 RepID=UPI0011808325|nr:MULTISPECIES: hypothetical protein [Paenibacillus]
MRTMTWFADNQIYLLAAAGILICLLALPLIVNYLIDSYDAVKARNNKEIGYIYPDKENHFLVYTEKRLEYSSTDILQIEIWNGLDYISTSKDEIIVPEMSGTRARIKVNRTS